MGRFGTVDEVAAVAVMLAANGSVTGQTVNVNGGWYTGIAGNARSILACPGVLAAWFGEDPRPVAEAVVHLDRLTRTCREVRGRLGEFAPGALPGSRHQMLIRSGQVGRTADRRLQIIWNQPAHQPVLAGRPGALGRPSTSSTSST
jgi:hypothetical protein